MVGKSYLRQGSEQRLRLEMFFVFLGGAGLLVPAEFGYFALHRWMLQHGVTIHHPETWLDSQIPFIPEFVWPYWAYFGFLGLVVWMPRNRREMAKVAYGLLGVHALGYLSYLIYPTAMQRIAIGCDSLSCGMVGAMYVLDPGYGLFPSLHAACSAYMIMASFAYKSPVKWLATALGVSIIAATVLIKQHYIVDVPAGILLGVFGGRWIWRLVDSAYGDSAKTTEETPAPATATVN